ncbi:hypothetical protein G3M48_000125, partial [Beauveria asiatica]
MEPPKLPLDLCINTCIQKPRHRLHPPPSGTPLRIRIQGPLESIEKLLPEAKWHSIVPFPQPGGVELANLTHEAFYIDYYGVTFDHLVPRDCPDPEVLVINIIELDNNGGIYADGGLYANEVLAFP